jgi:hypothetical protein
MPPEFVTFMDAVHDGQPPAGVTANVSEFPDLTVPAPLVLTIDEHGWYRVTVVDRETRQETSGYVRRAWAEERTLALLGVSKSGFTLRSR